MRRPYRHPRRDGIARPLPSTFRPLAVAALGATLLAGALACQPQAPEERIAELRAEYEAELSSFSVRETPMLEEAGFDTEPMAGEAAGEGTAGDAGDAGEGGEADMETPADAAAADAGIVEEVPVQQDVLLDVILRKEGSSETLPGLTLDVYQQGADGNEKANYRFFVETAGLNKGSQRAVSYVLEDVDYAEGDGFAVEIRTPIPPELYGEYQEFSQVAEGGGE